jgi:tetratricopeptide (TPR) repeat protein
MIAYTAIAWLTMQFGDLTLEAFDAPAWIMQLVLVLLLIGLPVVVALSWIFDLTPEGVLRTAPRELKASHHDLLSAVMAITAPDSTRFEPSTLRSLKSHCDRFGAHSTESDPESLISRFDNAHEALHCVIFLQSLMPATAPCRSGLSIGEAGWHDKHLQGDAVDIAHRLARFSPQGGLAVSNAFYDAILDHAGNPLREQMRRTKENLNHHPVTIYLADSELLAQPAILSWQHVSEPDEKRAGQWVTVTALLLLAVIAFGLWRWLPKLELPGMTKPEPSIAVLPFQDLSRKQANQWFVAGLGEEVLTTIAGIRGLRVTSRRTALDYQKQHKDISAIGEQLGVNHLLEGSVNRDGQHIRINMRLSSTEDGSLRWAQNYDASPEDLIRVQQDIAQRVAASLQVALSSEEMVRLERVPAIGPDAYTMYLEAIGYLRQPSSKETLSQAQSRLSQVVVGEPDFKDALAALCRTNLQWYTLTQDSDYFELAQQQCGTVLQANRENVSAMLALGQLYIAKGDEETAIDYFQRGLGLDSNDVELQSGLATALRHQGKQEEAEALIRQAIQIEPGSWGLYSQLGSLYISMGRNSEAVASYDRAFDLIPDNASVLGNVGSAYYYLGEFRRAALAYERSLEFDPTGSAYSNIATLWFYEGSFEKAKTYYEKAAELAPSDYRVWSNLADAESQLPGQEDQARQHYGEAMALAEKLLEINPANADVLSLLGWCAVNLGQQKLAGQSIEEAIRIAPDDPNIAYIAATVFATLNQLGHMRSAVEHSIETGFPVQILLATPILEGKLEFLNQPLATGEE